MKRTNILKVIAFVLFAGIAASSAGYVRAADSEERMIYAGVYLDSVYVGGLTKNEAIAEYKKYVDGIEDLDLTFSTSVGDYTITLGDINVSVSAEDAVEQALNYGRQGNILSRYKEIKALEEKNVVLIPEKKFNEAILKEKLENETSDIVREGKNASISRENGEFIIHDGETGTAIKVDDTMKEVEDIFAEEWKQKDIKISAAVEEKEPKYTAEDFKKIDSILGSGSTDYSQGQTARSQNLSTGASKISGTVLMPDEQFSVYNTVSPFNEENGYANAGQYVSNGSGDIELVDGYGGGICQVSTTLYLAVLRAELDVNERYPHSLTVSYVKHGMDAAIAGDYMDFKFTNDTGYPIYIEGYAGGGTISFSIYGHETRASNRTIEFESIDVAENEPGESEKIKDDTLEEGKTVTEQAPHTGYDTELWKHVYVDGVETEKYIVDCGRSHYQSQRGKVRVGTKKADKDKDKKNKNKKDKDDDDDDSDSDDDEAEEPTETETVTEAKPSEGGGE